MRKVTFRVANSLDNYIARQDGSFDWIRQSEASSSSLAELWKTIDTVLWGRKTYDLVKGRMPVYQGVKNYVFSRTLKESADQGVELIKQDAAKFVKTGQQIESGRPLEMIPSAQLRCRTKQSYKIYRGETYGNRNY